MLSTDYIPLPFSLHKRWVGVSFMLIKRVPLAQVTRTSRNRGENRKWVFLQARIWRLFYSDVDYVVELDTSNPQSH